MRKKQTSEEELLERLAPKPDFILEIENRLKADDLLGINIGALEGRFLQWLITTNAVEKIVEIGTQYGCSTLWMAEALESNGQIYTLEKNALNIAQAQKTFASKFIQNLTCKIELCEGDAAESLKALEKRAPFDLVFIDANKSGYLDYYRWGKEFLKSGGLLVADNVYLFGTMFQPTPPEQISEKMWKAMNRFLIEIFEDPQFSCSFVPTAEGLLVATKK